MTPDNPSGQDQQPAQQPAAPQPATPQPTPTKSSEIRPPAPAKPSWLLESDRTPKGPTDYA